MIWEPPGVCQDLLNLAHLVFWKFPEVFRAIRRNGYHPVFLPANWSWRKLNTTLHLNGESYIPNYNYVPWYHWYFLGSVEHIFFNFCLNYLKPLRIQNCRIVFFTLEQKVFYYFPGLRFIPKIYWITTSKKQTKAEINLSSSCCWNIQIANMWNKPKSCCL